MSKKICIFVLSLAIALAATIGVGISQVPSGESEVTLCDQPYARISF